MANLDVRLDHKLDISYLRKSSREPARPRAGLLQQKICSWAVLLGVTGPDFITFGLRPAEARSTCDAARSVELREQRGETGRPRAASLSPCATYERSQSSRNKKQISLVQGPVVSGSSRARTTPELQNELKLLLNLGEELLQR